MSAGRITFPRSLALLLFSHLGVIRADNVSQQHNQTR